MPPLIAGNLDSTDSRCEMMSWCGEKLSQGRGLPLDEVQHIDIAVGKEAALGLEQVGLPRILCEQQQGCVDGARILGGHQRIAGADQASP